MVINAECGKTVRIAYQGENNRQQVRFDLSDIMAEFPGGTAVLAILRSGDTDPVPAAEVELDTDGQALVWTVTAWECAVEGFVYAQVTYAVDQVVAKTRIWRFDVKNSLVVSGAEPEDWQDLVGQLVTAADGVNSAISAAMNTLDEKVAAAEAAQDAAEDAQEAAETARDQAVEAVGQYDAMTAEATGLAAGEEPTAVIDHTGDHPVLRLGIPAGERGADGARGPQGERGPAGPAGDPTALIDDTAGAGDTDVTFSADKLTTDHNSLLSAINQKLGLKNIGNGLHINTDTETGRTTVDADVTQNDITNLQQNKADIIISSASGSIASISDGADDLPVESLVVEIEPVQDLHGYDNPWPGGNTKNKMPNAIPKTETINGITFKLDDVGVFTVTGTATAEANCDFPIGFSFIIPDGDPKPKLALNNTQSNSALFKFFNSSVQVDSWGLTPANRAQEYSGMRGKTCNSYRITVPSGTTVNMTISPMIIENSVTDYTYIPYSNICPISGWTGANVYRTGKNMLNPSLYGWQTKTQNGITYEVQTDGSIHASGTATATGGPTLCSYFELPNGTYSWLDESANHIRCAYRKRDKASGSTSALANPFTVDGSFEIYINIYCDASSGTYDYYLHPQINLGSTASDFAPYVGTTYPITWESAGTVYGGTVNPVTGKLIVDRVSVSLVGKTSIALWAVTTAGIVPAYINATNFIGSGAADYGFAPPKINERHVITDWLKYGTDVKTELATNMTTFGGVFHRYEFSVPIESAQVGDTSAMHKDEVVAYLNAHPLQLVYELAEPLVYDLTPAEIRTLLGTNNIWADTGDVSVDYRADTRLYVEGHGGGVSDVQVNGSSVVTDGVANVPVASESAPGTVKVRTDGAYGAVVNSGELRLSPADSGLIKRPFDFNLSSANRPIVPKTQHQSVFYGLSYAAGYDEKSSTLPVGQYTESAKSAIASMLDAPETISGTTPSITAKAGVRYVCGEVSTLTIVVPSSGCIDVTFESGSTATVLTVTPPSGMTMKWANGFDPTALEANTTYEINIMDGCLGVAGSWT